MKRWGEYRSLLGSGKGDLFLEAPEEVGHYRRKYEYLQGSALSVEESAAYLEKLMNLLG